ncbi:MAG: tRNA (adenosine(37)-N6)-threonylcarbamoyltransferase complex ATPase subunit type 1 TsaE [Gammaproteobacteria bacterium]|nr:tRNA (adenosine(37)-N6)-threonylcarbamoyltransferase complex ATPase subunit type 1 TsaE [Gammaproteobacteria bacterium]
MPCAIFKIATLTFSRYHKQMNITIHNETEMLALGQQLAQQWQAPKVVFLQGDLGAGKTTLTRGVLRGWGYEGTIKSPTFTLVEPYQFKNFAVYHFDLYRLREPDELEHIGIRDYFTDDAICIIEWPEQGQGFLPVPDVSISITVTGDSRTVRIS